MIATPYHRVRHACITRSMIVGLSNGARLVLEGLRWALPDEVPTEITQADIADAANVSGATVNRVLVELADAGFLIWASVPRSDRRGWRWQITMLPPPEVQERSGVDQEPPNRSEPDRADVVALGPAQPIGALESPKQDRSPADRQLDHVLAHDQQQQDSRLSRLSDGQLLLYNALRAEKATHQKALEILHACPDRTPTELATQIRLAAALGKRKPNGFIFWLWAQGQSLQEHSPVIPAYGDEGQGGCPSSKELNHGSHHPRRPAAARAEGSQNHIPSNWGLPDNLAFLRD